MRKNGRFQDMTDNMTGNMTGNMTEDMVPLFDARKYLPEHIMGCGMEKGRMCYHEPKT